jgi:multiple sugar transport system permease protein
MYVFRRTISYGHLGYGSALAWIVLIILTVVTVIIFKSADKWVYYQSEGE